VPGQERTVSNCPGRAISVRSTWKINARSSDACWWGAEHPVDPEPRRVRRSLDRAAIDRRLGAVSRTVPDGFEAYVRICRPACDVNDNPVTWSEVAAVTGRRAHPLMQWHALVGASDPSNVTGSLWPGSSPERGNLAADILGESRARAFEDADINKSATSNRNHINALTSPSRAAHEVVAAAAVISVDKDGSTQ
jgi:hypothetical protein